MYINSSKTYNGTNTPMPYLRNSILPAYVLTPLRPAPKALPTLPPQR